MSRRVAAPRQHMSKYSLLHLHMADWGHQVLARSRLTTTLLIIHGLVAVALLGAITHQTLATWVPARSRPNSFCRRVRTVPSAAFTNAIVILYAVSALLGALLYLPFRVAVRVELERALGALIIGVVATSLPDRWTHRVWWLDVGGSRRSHDCVRLSIAALVSTLADPRWAKPP
jgi:hypothetical protein